MIINWKYYIVGLFFLFCCTEPKNSDRGQDEVSAVNRINSDVNSGSFGEFDISEDDSSVYITKYVKDKSEIWRVNLNNGTSTQLFTGKGDTSYANPRISSDGKKIIFLAYKKSDLKSALYIANITGSDKKRISAFKELITEAIFSNNDKEIYICKSKTYDNYSPIAQKAPHDFSIYSYNLESKQVKKVVSKNFYGVGSITDIDDENIMAELTAQGVYFLKKNSNTIKQFKPNIGQAIYDLIYNPIYSPKYKKIAFNYSGRMLYVTDENGICTLLDKSNGQVYGFASFFNTQNKFLVLKSGRLFEIDIESKQMKELKIKS